MPVYRTEIKVAVFSTYPIERVNSLIDIGRGLDDGDLLGNWMESESVELTEEEAREALIDYGTEPEYFGYALVEDTEE